MSKNLEIKKQVVSDIVEKIKNAKSMVVVSYNGLTVEAANQLRAQCRENDVEYCVLKNTLVRRALNELNITGMDDVLNGPSAFVFGMKDPVSAAKVVDDFITKTRSKALEMKAGLMDGNVMNADQVKALASVPSREILLARLLGCLQNSVASLVRVLDAIAKKDGEGAEAPAAE